MSAVALRPLNHREVVLAYALWDAVQALESMIECNLLESENRTDTERQLRQLWETRLKAYRKLQQELKPDALYDLNALNELETSLFAQMVRDDQVSLVAGVEAR